jgi:hypothetical protein
VEHRRAVLSSASTSLEELLKKVSAFADQMQQEGDESTAHDLYEVERSLRQAYRRLSSVSRRVR